MNSTSIFIYLNNTSLPLQISIILPEYFSFIFLALILHGMYKGVEIGHPLFAVLFLNLIVTAVSSALNVVAFAALQFPKFVMFFNNVNFLALLFHCTSWCLTSAIRYLYLSHEEWLFETFPSQKTQCHIAKIVSILFTLLHFLPVMIVMIIFGWPQVAVLSLPAEKIAIVGIVILSCLASPITISCFFYMALLCNKNKPFENKVSPEIDAQTVKTNVETVQLQNLNQAQGQDQNQAPKNGQCLELSNSFNEVLLKQKKQKYQEQVTSAKRSLCTNLCVASVIAITLVVAFTLPKPANFYWIVIASAIEKSTLPIVTSLANFGNIKFAFFQYCHVMSM